MAVWDFGFSIPRGGIEEAIVPQAEKNNSKGKNGEQSVVAHSASAASHFWFLPFDF